MDELVKKSPLPIISIMDVTCDYAALKGYKKLALLGTLPTMENDFFKKPFAEKGIDIVVPDPAERQFIGKAIENELEYGLVKQETVEKMKGIAGRMIEEEDVQGIILGCTELPLVFDSVELPVEKLDVMRLHIDKLIDLILQ